LGRAPESLTASFSNEHSPQFKIKNSKFTIPPLSFVRPFAAPRPSDSSEGPRCMRIRIESAWRRQGFCRSRGMGRPTLSNIKTCGASLGRSAASLLAGSHPQRTEVRLRCGLARVPCTSPNPAPRHSLPASRNQSSCQAGSDGRPVPVSGRGLPRRAQHEYVFLFT
jgi:hypothetical protein